MHLPRGLNLEFLGKYKRPIAIFFVLSAIGLGIYLWNYSSEVKSERLAVDTSCVLSSQWLVESFGTGDLADPRVGGCAGDPDDDILTNEQEYFFGTDPNRADTDGDGDIDSYEIAYQRNPLGEGVLGQTLYAEDYFEQLLKDDPSLAAFSKETLTEEINSVLQPNQAVVFDLPDDSELAIAAQNGPEDFERYFEAVRDLVSTAEDEYQNLSNLVFDDMSDAELDSYITRLRTIEELLKKVSVPSQIVDIQKFEIAGIRAAVSLFELVRDRYDPDNQTPQFWTEVFNRITAIQTAKSMELAAWNNLGTYLKDTGGWEELK